MTQGNLGEFHSFNIPGSFLVHSWGIHQELVGECKELQFLDKFLPISQDTPKCPNWEGAFTSLGSAGKEVDMYAPFISMALVSASFMPH
jgi:hypothetical protein